MEIYNNLDYANSMRFFLTSHEQTEDVQLQVKLLLEKSIDINEWTHVYHKKFKELFNEWYSEEEIKRKLFKK